jgi:hypothetical protein
VLVAASVLLGMGQAPKPAVAADWQGFVAAPEQALKLPPPRVIEGFAVQAGGTDPKPSDAVELVAAEEPATESDPCDEEAEACEAALEKLFEDRLAAIDLDIRVGGRAGNDYPCECRLEGKTYQPRRFATTTFTWTAAGYCHKPLYFEDWMLERYGHSYGPAADPFLSAAHFFVTLPVLPYKMGTELPWECVYPLGYYRPGNCAPWTVPAIPISARGFAVQAATVTGLVFLLP